MKTFSSCIFYLLLLCPSLLRAQIIPFDNYSVLNGLPSNLIYDIEQDDRGYLWLATQVGLVKFDGNNFTTFTTEDGLPDNFINDIFIDSHNRMWIATENGGLAVSEGNQIKQITENEGLVSNYSKKIFEDYIGNLWYVSYNGISRINNDTIENFSSSEGISGEAYAMYVALDSSVWFSTLNDVLVYKNNALTSYKNDLFSESIVRDITEDSKGSYWFATEEQGVIHITDLTTVHYNTENILPSNICLDVTAIDSGEVLIGTSYPGSIAHIRNDFLIRLWDQQFENEIIREIVTDTRNRHWIRTHENGVVLLEKGSLQHISEANGLMDNRPTKIFEDRNGNIWIPTYNGLSKYGKTIFEIYKNDFIEDDYKILSISEYQNTIYAGSYSGLNLIHDKKIETIDVRQKEINLPSVFSLCPSDQDNSVWLGTYSGLSMLLNDQIIYHSLSELFKDDDMPIVITDITTINDTVWCATDNGLITYSNGAYFQYSEQDGLINNKVSAIGMDKADRIWCATVAGLSIFEGHSFHNYDTVDGLAHYYCNDIAFDSNNIAYIATDKGLSIVQLNDDWTISCKNITAKNGLLSEMLFSVLVDKLGVVWVGHSLGIAQIDPDDFKITNYGQEEGFLPVETSSRAATTTSENDIWFGTVDGVVRYVPENDILAPDPPLVYISNVGFLDDTNSILAYSQGFDEFNLPKNLNLKFNKNSLVFKYVGIHYTIIKKNQYKYKLEGYDDSWSLPSTAFTTSYRRIPPGNYTFKVLAANCDGVWTTEPTEYSFQISPPFWKTKLFYIFEFILFITALVLFIRLRERKLRKDKEDLAQKVKERTIEVEHQRDQIAMQKQEITDSIVYAERIQDAVLPGKNYIDDLLKDYFIFFKPRDIVSGDFYWLNGNEEKLILVASDCTGHGVPGAFMSMLGISILNEIASSNKQYTAGKILDILRDHLTTTLWQSGKDEEAKDGMDMVLCTINYTTRQIQFAGAYNPLLVLRDGELTIYKGDKMPVGFHFGEMPSFTTHEFSYEKGDCLYMFSDGYADQFGGPKGKKFMSKRFRELLLEISRLPMKEQKIKLSETIQDWMGINEQVDDMLVVGLRL